MLMAMWAPPDEKGKFTSALVGGAIGTVTTWPLAGWLIEAFGWEFAFYVPAILAGVFTLAWFFVTFASPASHPRIAPEEKEYIERCLTGITRTRVIERLYYELYINNISMEYLRIGHRCSAC